MRMADRRELPELPDHRELIQPLIAGERPRLRPTVGLELRDTPIRGPHYLLYAGHDNAVYGDTGTGKTMLALALCAAVLRAGGSAFYLHAEEADAGSSLERLIHLFGMGEAVLTDRFRIITADELHDEEDLLDAATARAWTLVVLDGANELAGTNGYRVMGGDTDDWSKMRHRYALPFARKRAAVLWLDHGPKDQERAKQGQGGTAHKLNAATGAVYHLLGRTEEIPFREGHDGSVGIFVRKDRHGGVLRLADPHTRYLGRAVVTAAAVGGARFLTLHGHTPVEIAAPDGARAQSTTQGYIVAALERGPVDSHAALMARLTEAGHGKRRPAVKEALAGLCDGPDPVVEWFPVGRGVGYRLCLPEGS